MSYWAPMVLLLALAINAVVALGLAWGVTSQAAFLMLILTVYMGLQALLRPLRFRDLEVCTTRSASCCSLTCSVCACVCGRASSVPSNACRAMQQPAQACLQGHATVDGELW